MPGVLDSADGERDADECTGVPGESSRSGESRSGPRDAAGFSCAAAETDCRLALPNRSNLCRAFERVSGVRCGLARLDVSAASRSRPIDVSAAAPAAAHLQRVHTSIGAVAEWAVSASFLPNSGGMRPVSCREEMPDEVVDWFDEEAPEKDSVGSIFRLWL